MRLVQAEVGAQEQDMATGADMAKAGNRLGNGRTNRTGNLPLADSGQNMGGPTAGNREVALSSADPSGGVGVADGKASTPPALEWDRAANIHVRLMRAQAEAKALEKTQAKGEGAGFLKNGYVSHEVVTHEAVRILTRNGVHFAHYLKSHTQDGNRTVVETEGVFTNVDKPEEKLVFPGFGYGVDQSDKGPGKGLSYAKKIVLSQALMLSTHEDIENHATQYQPRVAPEAIKNAEAAVDVSIRAWADTFNMALKNCTSKKQLKEVSEVNSAMMQTVPEATRNYFKDRITQLEAILS